MCFMFGFWSDSIMDLFNNKSVIKAILQNILERLGRFGKLVAEAWRESDKADSDRKEILKNMKENNNSPNNNKNNTG